MAGGKAGPLEAFERGDPGLVDLVRGSDAVGELGELAGLWLDDPRPEARRALLDYLDRPLNACRHEVLVKRLFKKAEAAGDDEVMGRFLVLFDRSARRARTSGPERSWRFVGTEDEARALAEAWKASGYRDVGFDRPSRLPWGKAKRPYSVWGSVWRESLRVRPGSAMPRERPGWVEDLGRLSKYRLFSVATRHYLRRRAWRYFRRIGRVDPARYLRAVSGALILYRDEDAADGLALIDNWGLIHVLFHHTPALEARPSGWKPRPGRSLAELAPAPIYPEAWDADPGAAVDLLARARGRAVRRWAAQRIEADPDRSAGSRPAESWLGLLGHDDPEVAATASAMLGRVGGLDAIAPDRWLAIAESAAPAALDAIAALVARHVGPDRATVEQAARLAMARAVPLARLGLAWLKARGPKPGEADAALLGLVDAACDSVRPEILRWLRGALAGSEGSRSEMILAFLDARHADARAEGWAWFLGDDEARGDVGLWRRLIESPHEDIRVGLARELQAWRDTPLDPARALDPVALRALWASVLLGVARGSRIKPGVVEAAARRLSSRPEEAGDLLPILGVALRSIRGAERRAGLVAVVGLVEGRPELAPLVRGHFPELQWDG